MKATFEHTVNILVQAYLNDELAHKMCSACAVGNIIANALGTKPKRLPETEHLEFDNNLFENGQNAFAWYETLNSAFPNEEGDRQIFLTGYSKDQIRDIEKAFESAPGEPGSEAGLYRGKCVDPTWMFNGLMAVVDVLADIHNIDLSQKNEAKKLFVKV